VADSQGKAWWECLRLKGNEKPIARTVARIGELGIIWRMRGIEKTTKQVGSNSVAKKRTAEQVPE